MHKLQYNKAICYSGFREGQSPITGIFPSREQVKEDLYILKDHWKFIRLYDCDKLSETVLEIIKTEGLDLKVMLGAFIGAEMNNFNCPWGGGTYSEEELTVNKEKNFNNIKKLIRLANEYPNEIMSLSAGNEACVDWTDHYVHEDQVIEYVRMIKASAKQPVTFCDNHVPWFDKLKNLVEEVDFISIHSYPVWEYKHIDEAMEVTKQNYYSIAERYPNKQVVITEAGWATNSNGRGIEPNNVSEEHQETYYKNLMKWANQEGVITFVFEAFDEPWKGSQHPLEPEKHWGLFNVERKPKKVMQNLLTQSI
ncbi:MAG: exo-beta-1,3-glucanase (GH17 family) [Cyclobacteriaceae bacterium]